VEIASAGILERQKLRCYNGIMQMNSRSLSQLIDAQLIVEVKALAAGEREATAHLIASLAELDARRLYLGEGYSSLFTYCTQCLHLSEHAAYNRIEAARAARRWPVILDLLAEGALTLTTVRLLAPQLTDDNHRGVLDAARHKGKRDVEEIVAALHPQPDIAATVRRLPASRASSTTRQGVMTSSANPSVELSGAADVASAAASEAAPVVIAVPAARSRPSVVSPLAPERYNVQVTVSRQTYDKLRRVQDLLRHSVPNGDPAEIFDRALTLLVEHLERTRLASAKHPSAPRAAARRSRHIPASVKRAVWHRDAARCGFVGAEGRCEERGFLEFHHAVPYADGGLATVDNIQLRCRAHNQHEAELWSEPAFLRERPTPRRADMETTNVALTGSCALLRS
jgi:5-methylcytosine-specific restriction endonuclease McrA